MTADLLVTGISQLVSPGGDGVRRGASMAALDIVVDAAFSITRGQVDWVGPRSTWHGAAQDEVDLGGRAVVPGLVDPHTHAIWAGDRLEDFEARTVGVAYEEILRRGGGIRRTIRETAACSLDQLVALAEPRLRGLLASGATTIEVKSGYGFTRDGEMASLEAIRRVAERTPATIVPTLLIHLPPRDAAARDDYLTMVANELIPDAARAGLAAAVDVFIEREAFAVDEARRFFDAARAAGLRIKAHVDQFHAVGGLELALECHALSVDHLEASEPEGIRRLAASDTVGVILPGVTLHLGLPAAKGRAMIDAGCAVATATDLNPGSSPIYSTQFALALAVRLNGLTPAEALTAATANAAAALGRTDIGRVRHGHRADFVALAGDDWRDIACILGGPVIERVFIAGQEVTQ